MGNETKLVMLKNGIEEVAILVPVVMMRLQNLLDKQPMVLYDLAMRCRDQNYQCFGNAEQELIDMGLLQPDGQPHNSISNIVKSAAEGEGLNLSLVNPVKG